MPDGSGAAGADGAIHPSSAARVPHPLIFLLLILPFGASSGFVTVTLAYQLAQAGVDTALVGGMIGLTYVPQSWKFLWAPVTDTTLTRKSWYVIGAVLTGVTFIACGLVPIDAASLPVLSALLVLNSAATTLLAMAVEALMAYNTPLQQKGRASGWFQAGNLGGHGLGGGAGLWIAQHAPVPWLSATALGMAALLCTLPLLRIAEPPRHPEEAVRGAARSALRQQWSHLAQVLMDILTLVLTRRGFLALLVVFLPLGTGAAGGLWAAAADNWHASANTVALITGTLGGAVSVMGCMAGGYLCDRLDRKTAYMLFGAIQALCAVAIAMAPRTEAMFVVLTMLYALSNGLSFAAFSAVVLETIGLRAAASQYNVYASLSNMPIGYMVYFEGLVNKWSGTTAMLYFEAAIAALSIAVFAGVSKFTEGRMREAQA